jgi:Holliday junction resolvase RusA-like endonuclease
MADTAVAPPPMVITIPGVIRGKQRPRFGRGRTYTPEATVNAEAHMKACAIEQVGQPCLGGPLALSMAISVMVPDSWSKKKRAAALAGEIRPTGKPDADNALKMAADALNGVVWRDDAQLVDVNVSKRYGEKPGAVLTIQEA